MLNDIRTDAIKIKCRGHNIDTHKIPNSPVTLTRAFFKGATIFFSCDEPIAIKYNDGKAIMLFKKLGAITLENRKLLRSYKKFDNVVEQDFNAALFDLLSKR